MIYSQNDSRWSGLKLGKTSLTCAKDGCDITDIAQVFFDAGYENITPATLIETLNSDESPENAEWTNNGEVVYTVITKYYPEFHYGTGNYELIKGLWGKSTHFVLKDPAGLITNPWEGTEGLPTPWSQESVQAISVDEIQPTQPTPEFPRTVTVEVGPLHVRTEPNNTAPISSTLAVGSTFEAVEEVTGGEYEINGQTSSQWVKSSFGHYVALLGVK